MIKDLKSEMISKYVDFYKKNLQECVIPFWVKYSPDRINGGTYSCLNYDGSVYDSKKYVWLLARSAWMFSKLYNTYEKNPEFIKIAKSNLDFIDKFATDVNGEYYFGLCNDGRPASYRSEIYDSVFTMLALVEYSKAELNEKNIAKAKLIYSDIRDRVLWNIDTSTVLPRLSCLADLMILIDMAVKIYEVEPDQQYLDVLQKVVSRIKKHFYPEKKVLLETVSCDGTDLFEWTEGRFCSPGHSIEVAWFLLHAIEYISDDSLQIWLLEILESSLELGWDKEYGGIYNYIDVMDLPGIFIESQTKLWWPHAEAIYAIMLAYKKTGDSKWIDWLDKVHNYAVEHFVDEQNGGWYGFCDRYGNLINKAKGSHSKGFFHVPRALLYSIQLYE